MNINIIKKLNHKAMSEIMHKICIFNTLTCNHSNWWYLYTVNWNFNYETDNWLFYFC